MAIDLLKAKNAAFKLLSILFAPSTIVKVFPVPAPALTNTWLSVSVIYKDKIGKIMRYCYRNIPQGGEDDIVSKKNMGDKGAND